jgi:hypothetical protein
MNKRQLAAYLCKKEKGKSEAKIGDVMQLLTELELLLASDLNELQIFIQRVAKVRAKIGAKNG